MTIPRVLLVRTGAMGDVLHALPAVTALRAMWPEAQIDWVVEPRWAPLLVDAAGRGPVVSKMHLAETKLWSKRPLSWATARSIAGLRRRLRDARYGTIVDVQGTLRSALIGRMTGAGTRLGFADPREAAAGLLYTRTFARQGEHVVQQNAALLGEALALGLTLQPQTPLLPLRADAEAWAEQVRAAHGPIALLAPTAGWGAKQWPATSFGALAKQLGALGYTVLVNAAGAHDPVAREAVHASAGSAQEMVCDVAQLVALTRRVAVVVGGDSGPLHLAAALGRPVVALFGPTNPARNGPWGIAPSRVLREASSVTTYRRDKTVEAGLATISVQAVVEAVQAVMPPR